MGARNTASTNHFGNVSFVATTAWPLMVNRDSLTSPSEFLIKAASKFTSNMKKCPSVDGYSRIGSGPSGGVET